VAQLAPTTPTEPPTRDPATRQAALWATVVAVPLAILVALFAFHRVDSQNPVAEPTPSATIARPQSTAPVPVAAPALAERPATVCRALLSQLPATVRELAQRPVQAGPEQNAAYGDPALTVACGVTAVSYPKTDDVWVVNGVCWHPADGPAATVLTTVDREVPVQVTVPHDYPQALQWAAPVAESVVASVPSTQTVPAGCTG
jgi:hypothetical protein